MAIFLTPAIAIFCLIEGVSGTCTIDAPQPGFHYTLDKVGAQPDDVTVTLTCHLGYHFFEGMTDKGQATQFNCEVNIVGGQQTFAFPAKKACVQIHCKLANTDSRNAKLVTTKQGGGQYTNADQIPLRTRLTWACLTGWKVARDSSKDSFSATCHVREAGKDYEWNRQDNGIGCTEKIHCTLASLTSLDNSLMITKKSDGTPYGRNEMIFKGTAIEYTCKQGWQVTDGFGMKRDGFMATCGEPDVKHRAYVWKRTDDSQGCAQRLCKLTIPPLSSLKHWRAVHLHKNQEKLLVPALTHTIVFGDTVRYSCDVGYHWFLSVDDSGSRTEINVQCDVDHKIHMPDSCSKKCALRDSSVGRFTFTVKHNGTERLLVNEETVVISEDIMVVYKCQQNFMWEDQQGNIIKEKTLKGCNPPDPCIAESCTLPNPLPAYTAKIKGQNQTLQPGATFQKTQSVVITCPPNNGFPDHDLVNSVDVTCPEDGNAPFPVTGCEAFCKFTIGRQANVRWSATRADGSAFAYNNQFRVPIDAEVTFTCQADYHWPDSTIDYVYSKKKVGHTCQAGNTTTLTVPTSCEEFCTMIVSDTSNYDVTVSIGNANVKLTPGVRTPISKIATLRTDCHPGFHWLVQPAGQSLVTKNGQGCTMEQPCTVKHCLVNFPPNAHYSTKDKDNKAVVNQDKVLEGSVLTITCKTNYRWNRATGGAQRTVTCQSDGTLVMPAPCTAYCQLTLPPRASQHWTAKAGARAPFLQFARTHHFVGGTTIVFTCEAYYLWETMANERFITEKTKTCTDKTITPPTDCQSSCQLSIPRNYNYVSKIIVLSTNKEMSLAEGWSGLVPMNADIEQKCDDGYHWLTEGVSKKTKSASSCVVQRRCTVEKCAVDGIPVNPKYTVKDSQNNVLNNGQMVVEGTRLTLSCLSDHVWQEYDDKQTMTTTCLSDGTLWIPTVPCRQVCTIPAPTNQQWKITVQRKGGVWQDPPSNNRINEGVKARYTCNAGHHWADKTAPQASRTVQEETCNAGVLLEAPVCERFCVLNPPTGSNYRVQLDISGSQIDLTGGQSWRVTQTAALTTSCDLTYHWLVNGASKMQLVKTGCIMEPPCTVQYCRLDLSPSMNYEAFNVQTDSPYPVGTNILEGTEVKLKCIQWYEWPGFVGDRIVQCKPDGNLATVEACSEYCQVNSPVREAVHWMARSNIQLTPGNTYKVPITQRVTFSCDASYLWPDKSNPRGSTQSQTIVCQPNNHQLASPPACQEFCSVFISSESMYSGTFKVDNKDFTVKPDEWWRVVKTSQLRIDCNTGYHWFTNGTRSLTSQVVRECKLPEECTVDSCTVNIPDDRFYTASNKATGQAVTAGLKVKQGTTISFKCVARHEWPKKVTERESVCKGDGTIEYPEECQAGCELDLSGDKLNYKAYTFKGDKQFDYSACQCHRVAENTLVKFRCTREFHWPDRHAPRGSRTEKNYMCIQNSLVIPPACEPFCTIVPPVGSSYIVTVSMSGYSLKLWPPGLTWQVSEKKKLKFYCLPGYSWKNNPPHNRTKEACSLEPPCEMESCFLTIPPSPRYKAKDRKTGRVLSSCDRVPVGGYVDVECNEGFEWSGGSKQAELLCSSNGSLSFPKPCSPISCNVPAIPNTIVEPDVTSIALGTHVLYQCRRWHQFPDDTFEKAAECGSDGNLQPQYSDGCTMTTCDTSAPKDNSATCSYSAGATVNAGTVNRCSCAEGFRFIRSKTNTVETTCVGKNSWDMKITIQKCEKTNDTCRVPDLPFASSSLDTDHIIKIGGKVTFTCSPQWEFDNETSELSVICNTQNGWLPKLIERGCRMKGDDDTVDAEASLWWLWVILGVCIPLFLLCLVATSVQKYRARNALAKQNAQGQAYRAIDYGTEQASTGTAEYSMAECDDTVPVMRARAHTIAITNPSEKLETISSHSFNKLDDVPIWENEKDLLHTPQPLPSRQSVPLPDPNMSYVGAIDEEQLTPAPSETLLCSCLGIKMKKKPTKKEANGPSDVKAPGEDKDEKQQGVAEESVLKDVNKNDEEQVQISRKSPFVDNVLENLDGYTDSLEARKLSLLRHAQELKQAKDPSFLQGVEEERTAVGGQTPGAVEEIPDTTPMVENVSEDIPIQQKEETIALEKYKSRIRASLARRKTKSGSSGGHSISSSSKRLSSQGTAKAELPSKDLPAENQNHEIT